MSSTIKWLLGQKPQETLTADPKTGRGLPASWYRTPEMYELERRAIFSKYWMLTTHKNRFTNPGDYLRFTEAGFSFFLCMDREGKINGFHNVCRHRGFPLIHAEEGNTKILACKYHGWSYGINGKLAKAPHFEEFSDFDKAKNNLMPINVHIDNLGFIWVNLESGPPSIAWDDLFQGVDTRPVLSEFNLDEYKFDHTWGMLGDYNWKTLADNYNECYHCKTTHPDTHGLVEVHSYRVEEHKGSLQHYNQRQESGLNAKNGKMVIISTFYFPNACMTVSPHFMYMMRCVPTSVKTCSMEYEVYRHKDAADEDFDKIDQAFKRILGEDKVLCNLTQANLNSGVFVNGQMHDRYENGPLYIQKLVKEAVISHREAELKLKRDVWPASQSIPTSSDSKAEDDFCSGLVCGTAPEVLAW